LTTVDGRSARIRPNVRGPPSDGYRRAPGDDVIVDLPQDLIVLLNEPSHCYVATVMPDGGPQLTQTWVDTDGEHILINSVKGFQKIRNMERDSRVALNVSDAENPSRSGAGLWRSPRTVPASTSKSSHSVIWVAHTPGSEAATRPAC
jgi:hypothetical protein